jgi:putative transposase
MSNSQSPSRVRSGYEFIKRHRKQFGVKQMCRVLHVARSGYYEWENQPISNRALEDTRLLRL